MSRAQMFELARSLGWPRVELGRLTSGGTHDICGPGITPWYVLADQFPDHVIDDATAALQRLGKSRRGSEGAK